MAISSEEKCSICRYPCKSDQYKAFCKFYPKNEFLSSMVQESESGTQRRTCLVCKSSLNYRNIHWKREDGKWYPMCKDDAKTAKWIDKLQTMSSDEAPDWHATIYGGKR